MTTAMVLLWILGGLAFVATGYLSGAGRGRKERDRLRDDLEQANYEVEVFTKQADALSGMVLRDIQQDIQSAVENALDRESSSEAELGEIVGDVQSRGQLERLLDLIASKGQFLTVLVSDETGLPVATNRDAQDATEIAGLSSALLGFADRTVQVRRPAIASILLYDETKHATMHRIFQAGADRYLLSVVAQRAVLPLTMLDPVLGQIETVLTDRTWH